MSTTTMTGSLPLTWGEIRQIQADCSEELSGRLEYSVLKRPAQEALAQQIVVGRVGQLAQDRMRKGIAPITTAEERRIVEAVLAAMFGVGRLEPLLSDPDIEDIEISGHDNVIVTYYTGETRRMAPIADSDSELVDLISRLAATAGHRERALTDASPLMHMRLPNGSRLAATIGVTRRPEISIRNHRLVNITLTDMLTHGTVDDTVANLLRAAVHGRLNIVVTGNLGSGKTTLVRALLGEIPADERFATIETALELLVDEHRERVVAYEAQPGTGERQPDGTRAGEVTLHHLIEHSLLQHHRRIFLGEVRGEEIGPMLEVMQLGEGGSMSTLHARSAHHAINRMAVLVTTRTNLHDHAAAMAWVADAVDLIVHVRRIDTPGHRQRVVSNILAIGDYVDGRVTRDALVETGPDGVARLTETNPEILHTLYEHGFRPTAHLRAGGL